MAQDSQTQKPKWGMGNFFQQAVAGVESRLDNILLDEEERKKAANAKPGETASTGTPITKSPAGCTHTVSNLISLETTDTVFSNFPQRINRAQK
jgi:hypothetical protein